MLRLPLGPQTGHVHLDPFEGQLLLLLLQRLEQLLLLAILFFPFKLFRRNRLPRTRLRMSVVRRPSRSLFGVLLFAPLGPSVLKPNLTEKTVNSHPALRRGFKKKSYGNSGLFEVESHGQGFPHEDVRVVARLKGPLQLFQLPGAEVGAGTAPLARRIVQIGI